MKLSINLADREEIAAAIPLLQLIHDNTPTAKPLYDEFKEAQAADLRPPISQPDPVAVFGGAEVAVFGGAEVAPLAPSIPLVVAPSTSVPPLPANIAPITTTPGPVSSGAVAGSVELDSKGLPWDERIHSSSKAKVADGSWKAKRGVPPERFTAVEAELRGGVSPLVPSPPPAAPTIPAPPPVAPVGASSPIISASPDPATFEQLMPRITAAVTSGVMPPAAVGEACAANGVASVVALQQSPQFIPLVWATLRQHYPALA